MNLRISVGRAALLAQFAVADNDQLGQVLIQVGKVVGNKIIHVAVFFVEEKDAQSFHCVFPFCMLCTLAGIVCQNAVDFCRVAPGARAVIRTVRERAVVELDLVVLVAQELLHAVRQTHRLAGADIDDAVDLLLHTGGHDHVGQLVHVDEVIEVAAARERESLFAVLLGFLCRKK